MAISDISAYLNNPLSYAQGVELYCKHGSDDFLKSLFKKSETRYNRSRLLKELHLIYSKLSGPENSKQAKQRFSASDTTSYLSLPDQVKKLNEKKNEYYKEMRDLHSQLLHLDKEARYNAAGKILQLSRLVKEIWKSLDHFHIHGDLPRGAIKAEMIKEEPLKSDLIEKRNLLRSYVSKGRMWHKPELDRINEILKNWEGQ